MTLDVTIGKVVIYKDPKTGRASITVTECPAAETDITNPKLSLVPKSSWRSGSSSFWEFWQKNSDILSKIYEEMRDHPNSNDKDVTFLGNYACRINELSEDAFETELDKDRLKWLKYWTKKAVELYGEEAGISFS